MRVIGTRLSTKAAGRMCSRCAGFSTTAASWLQRTFVTLRRCTSDVCARPCNSGAQLESRMRLCYLHDSMRTVHQDSALNNQHSARMCTLPPRSRCTAVSCHDNSRQPIWHPIEATQCAHPAPVSAPACSTLSRTLAQLPGTPTETRADQKQELRHHRRTQPSRQRAQLCERLS